MQYLSNFPKVVQMIKCVSALICFDRASRLLLLDNSENVDSRLALVIHCQPCKTSNNKGKSPHIKCYYNSARRCMRCEAVGTADYMLVIQSSNDMHLVLSTETHTEKMVPGKSFEGACLMAKSCICS